MTKELEVANQEDINKDLDAIESYINHVYERGVMLIDNRLWDGIDIFRYKGWWKNFSGTEERLLAALLIDRLIYRSEEHMLSMLYDLFTMSIPNCMRICDDPNYKNNRKLLDILCNRCKSVRLVNINEDSIPSQSSGEIIHLVNHNMGVKRENIIVQKEIDKEYNQGVRTFILMDDMICSGEQIKKALDVINPSGYKEAFFYVAVCCACDDGINYVHDYYPQVGIAYTEYLTVGDHSFFKSLDYTKIPFESMEKLKEFYESFTTPRKFLSKKLYGKNDMSLVYAFQNSTPNASLPILYWKSSEFNQFLNKRGS